MSKQEQTYKQLLSTVKGCIRVAQVKTLVAANRVVPFNLAGNVIKYWRWNEL